MVSATKVKQQKANIKQERNKKYKTLVKKSLKEIRNKLVESPSDIKTLKELYKRVQKTLDKAATKGIIHKNKSARQKSQLIKQIESQSSLKNK